MTSKNPKKSLTIPTLFTCVGIILLLGLGSWQVKRLMWKEALVSKIEYQLSQTPLTLAEVLSEPEKHQYRRVRLKGRFLHEKEARLYTGPKILKGEPGYNLLTPLATDSGYVLVDRGWIPQTMKDPDKRQEVAMDEEAQFEAMLMPQETPTWYTPENQLAQNMWFWIDVPTMMGELVGNNEMYFRALKKEEKSLLYPIAGEAKINVRNDHLQYAITWYSLAIILIVIYILFRKQNRAA